MHVIEHILMEEQKKSTANGDGHPTEAEKKLRLQALEAKAVAEATATADAAFTPSPSLLNATTMEPLLNQVDGPSLENYEGKESIYVGRSVPVSAGGTLQVPIQVTTPGSVVEYAVEIKTYDIGFGITAEREEGVTIVKELERCDSTKTPVTGKFLVGSVPCLIQFKFENDYSWYHEKIVSYRVTVTPPSRETLVAGRQRRAQACLKAVDEDLASANQRWNSAAEQRTSLETELKDLQDQLEQTKKSLAVAEKEEQWLKDRVTLRKSQKEALTDRMKHGWEDDVETSTDASSGDEKQ